MRIIVEHFLWNCKAKLQKNSGPPVLDRLQDLCPVSRSMTIFPTRPKNGISQHFRLDMPFLSI